MDPISNRGIVQLLGQSLEQMMVERARPLPIRSEVEIAGEDQAAIAGQGPAATSGNLPGFHVVLERRDERDVMELRGGYLVEDGDLVTPDDARTVGLDVVEQLSRRGFGPGEKIDIGREIPQQVTFFPCREGPAPTD